jgi:hypothetical protein
MDGFAWVLPLIFGVMIVVGGVGFVVVARKTAALDREDRVAKARQRAEGEPPAA